MSQTYRLCILVYQQLTTLVREALSSLQFDDTDITVIESSADTLPYNISAILSEDYDVFIAGGANAAILSQYSEVHLRRFAVHNTDYLIAIRRAMREGKRPCIVQHSLSVPPNVELFSRLTDTEIGLLTFSDGNELREAIRTSPYDVFIGASQTCETARDLGRESMLVYVGADSIRRTITEARQFAVELRKEHRFSAITDALIRDTPIGIIITDEDGIITTINNLASSYIGIPGIMLKSRHLRDVARNLDPSHLSGKGLVEQEAFRIIGGIRFRCTQRRIQIKGQEIGTLTTLRIDNRKQSSSPAASPSLQATQWKHLITESPVMKQVVSLGNRLSMNTLPTAVIGEYSTNKHRIAECLHSCSDRAQQPLIVINLSTISETEAGRSLFGSTDTLAPFTGLIEHANRGTVILRNIQCANRAVQACLMDAISRNQYLPVGSIAPKVSDVRFITLFNLEDGTENIRPDLLALLTTQTIRIPSFRERREDLPLMFNRFVSHRYEKNFDIRKYPASCELLCFYNWPGNAAEMQAVSDRFSAAILASTRLSPKAVHSHLVNAIGEGKLAEFIRRRHQTENPETAPASETAGGIQSRLQRTADELKHYLGYTNAKAAESIGVSRTSLWRISAQKV